MNLWGLAERETESPVACFMLALLLVLPGWQLNVNVNEFPLEGKLTGLFISPHSGGPATFGVGARWPVRVQRAAATGGSGKCVVSARRGYRGPRRCVVPVISRLVCVRVARERQNVKIFAMVS